MKTAVVYTSMHGTTEKVACRIADMLRAGGAEVALISLEKERNPLLGEFDTVILGTSIHAGKPAKKMHRYVTETENKNVLETKIIGLFVCSMFPDAEKRAEQFEQAFPEYLRARAKASVMPGGEFLFEKMNWLERAIIRKVAKTNKSVSAIDSEAIAGFADRMR
jgi:menaquinone-dependent protoporphyrinogen oxidase